MRTAPAYAPDARFPVRSFDVEYRRDGTRDWLARIWAPQGTGPFPALLEVHGGAWENFDRHRDAVIIEPLAASGLVIAAIDFHSSREAPYPAAILDINYATRWLKACAQEFNAIGDHLGGLGISSGGHQLLLSAMRPRDARYAGLEAPALPGVGHDASLAYLVMGWVPIDPLDRFRKGPESLKAPTRRYFVDEAGMREANPQLILERGEPVALPPVLLLQGATDREINAGVPERFVEHYAAAGGLVEYAKFPNAGHAFMRRPGRNTDRALALIKSFIARRLLDGDAAPLDA